MGNARASACHRILIVIEIALKFKDIMKLFETIWNSLLHGCCACLDWTLPSLRLSLGRRLLLCSASPQPGVPAKTRSACSREGEGQGLPVGRLCGQLHHEGRWPKAPSWRHEAGDKGSPDLGRNSSSVWSVQLVCGLHSAGRTAEDWEGEATPRLECTTQGTFLSKF